MNENKKIELEIRAEVKEDNIDNLLSSLSEDFELESHTERMSVMMFGETNDGDLDARVRITNGNSEVVIKKGGFHTDDRIEIDQSIANEQFIGFVRMFELFNFRTEISERETHNFALPDSVVFSLVQAGKIAYVEIEKMTNEESVDENRKKLYKIADKYDLNLIETKEEFDELCGRLSEKSDWPFEGTDEDYKKLERVFNKYASSK